jgi:carbon monoxide dehydrogenase subunit G
MIRVHKEIDVARPPAEVFAFLDDIRQTPKWLTRCTNIEQTTSGPKAVGTKLRYSYQEQGRSGTMDGVVSEYEKDRRLAMAFTDPMMDVRVGFQVEPAAGGSRIVHEVEIEPRNFMAKMMTPMISSMTRKQMDSDTAKLKQMLESGA